VDQLNILAGRITAIVGPSGAGKTTLLRILAFLQSRDGGRLEMFGRTVEGDGSTALRRQVTLVTQQPLQFNGTVAFNVAYGLRVRGLPSAAVQARVSAAVAATGLGDLIDQPARTLSGGEAQRLAVARAMVIQPRLALLDEPTANLDPANVALLEDMIRRFARGDGLSPQDNGRDERRGEARTVVIVTHNIFQARRLADRAVFLCGGRVVEEGSAERVLFSPRRDETKAFLEGKMIY